MPTVTRISFMPCMPEINNETRLKPTGIAMLPYQQAASNKISSRLPAKYDMKTCHLRVKKTTQGKIGLKIPDVWCIPYGYRKVYVRQAGI